jgi:hypothetical protein
MNWWPVSLRPKWWQRNVWRWPTATPPTVPPSEPTTFNGTASTIPAATPLDVPTVLREGGWDARYASVLFIAEHDDLAIARIDANADGVDLNIDDFERGTDGRWRAGAASGSSGDAGTGMQGRVAYAYGRTHPGTLITVDYLGNSRTVEASEAGWWAFVAPFDPNRPDDVPHQRA